MALTFDFVKSERTACPAHAPVCSSFLSQLSKSNTRVSSPSTTSQLNSPSTGPSRCSSSSPWSPCPLRPPQPRRPLGRQPLFLDLRCKKPCNVVVTFTSSSLQGGSAFLIPQFRVRARMTKKTTHNLEVFSLFSCKAQGGFAIRPCFVDFHARLPSEPLHHTEVAAGGSH